MRLKLADLPDIVAYCDPASGKKQQLKKIKARSAIVVVGADLLRRAFVLHAWADRCPTDQLVERIFSINDQFKPRLFGIEANAMQSLFADSMTLEAAHRDKRLPLVAVTQSTKVEKDWRIRSTMQPIIAYGRLFIQDHQVELKSELTSFPLTFLKDLIDALSSAISMLPMRSSGRMMDEDLQAHLAYLRETGASPSYIQQIARSGVA
jgi:predicted phage terminase large subunit-like protein